MTLALRVCLPDQERPVHVEQAVVRWCSGRPSQSRTMAATLMFSSLAGPTAATPLTSLPFGG